MGRSMNLSEDSLLMALSEVRDGLIKLNSEPTSLVVVDKHMRLALKILGVIKHPVQRVSGLRKRKRALYWRKVNEL
jgi:hypothetical protein